MDLGIDLPIKIRNSSNTHMYSAIFIDAQQGPYSDHAVLTFRHKEDYFHEPSGKTFISLYRLYQHFTEEDPTEYEFAMAVFGNWEYWENLSNRNFIKDYVAEWRRERDQRQKMLAVKAMMKQVKNGTAPFSTLKYLADNGYIEKEQAQGVGRPSKQKIKQEAEKLFEDRSTVNEDWERLGLHGKITNIN